MNAPETLKPTTYPINLAHEVLLKADEALCVEEVARAILGGDKPTKACIKDAAKQLKKLADLGLIEMEPRAGGVPFYRLIAAPNPQVCEGASQTSSSAERVLTPEARTERDDFEREVEERGCTCFISPPCGFCMHPGNPRNQEEDETAWMAAGDSEGGETDAQAVDAQREEFTLLHLIADIRAAAGDPTGRLMQDDLVQHIAAIVKERDDLRERLDAQIKQWQADTSSLLADRWAAMEARSKAINEADRLRAELGAERLALTALQEQVDNPPAPVAQGYAVKAPKRPLRRFGKEAAAKSAAMAAARLAGRGEVFALVPLGVAVRGAEWKEA